MMIAPPIKAQTLGRSPTNKNTQTGFKSGSTKPMILASSDRTPSEIPFVNKMYAISDLENTEK